MALEFQLQTDATLDAVNNKLLVRYTATGYSGQNAVVTINFAQGGLGSAFAQSSQFVVPSDPYEGELALNVQGTITTGPPNPSDPNKRNLCNGSMSVVGDGGDLDSKALTIS
jgi:hypothetical protein